jgi:hypothetical protein
MRNVKTAHRTKLTVESIRYQTGFSDAMFSQQALERGGK